MNVEPAVRQNSSRAEKLLYILVATAIVHQILNQVRSNIVVDEAIQFITARSWLEGRAFSLLYATPRDLSKALAVPVPGWPPGISVAFALAWRLAGNPTWAIFALKAFATVLFFAAWWFILWSLRQWIGFLPRALLFGWWAFAGSPLQNLPCSDSLSLALFTASVAVNLLLFRRQRADYTAALIAAILIGSAAAIRFAYWPLAAVAPLSLAMAPAAAQRRRFLSLAFLELSISFLFIFVSGLYQYKTVGALVPLRETTS